MNRSGIVSIILISVMIILFPISKAFSTQGKGSFAVSGKNDTRVNPIPSPYDSDHSTTRWRSAGSYSISYPNGCRRTWSYKQWVNGKSVIIMDDYTSNCPNGKNTNLNGNVSVENGLVVSKPEEMSDADELLLKIIVEFDKKFIVNRKISKEEFDALTIKRSQEIMNGMGKSYKIMITPDFEK